MNPGGLHWRCGRTPVPDMTSICDTLRQLLVAQHEQLLRKDAEAAELWLLSGRQHGTVIERTAQPPLRLPGSRSPVPDEGTPGGATAVAGRSGACPLLPGGGGALWLPPGEPVRAAVQRVASELGVPASELALTGGGRVAAQGCAAAVLRLAWRARGGGGTVTVDDGLVGTDTLLDAKPLRLDWTVAKWLASLGVSEGEPEGVVARMLARALLPQPNKDGDNELHRIRQLAKDMPVEKLETTLCGVCKELAKELHAALGELAKETAVGVPPEGESKFAGGLQQLSFSGLDTFFGGLEGLVGAPAPKVREAMQAEHTDRVA
eukprot:scaffold5578_cov110-Isochrysis_galbana.AAC.2